MIILDYAKEPCLNICQNINLHKPDANEKNAGSCQQNCKLRSFYIAVNQMQVRILG